MSKRGQTDLEKEGNADTQPVRRSSRISSGQNATSSPAPRAIMTRRSSANSITEKINAETTASPRRITRRTSTDEEPKSTPIRTRRSSVSKVIEEEKTSTPGSPSRRNTRLSSSSPNLDVPARRTRRSSQDSETVEVPARRTTRRSSTGLQETTIEELIENSKPITRRRRSNSVDEPEENVKVETRNKTRKLFSEDSQLAPIVEQDQEVKEKETVEKKDAPPLAVIEELADEESDKIMKSIDEVLEEANRAVSEECESKKVEITDRKEKESTASPVKVVKEKISVEEQKETIENEYLEGKASPKKRLSLVSVKSSPKPKESAIEDQSLNKVHPTELSESSTEETTTKSTFNSPSSEKVTSPSKSPVVQPRTSVNVAEGNSVILTLKENDSNQEKSENKIAMSSSPGSDKENTSINIRKKRVSSLKFVENKPDDESEKNVSVVEKSFRNSICEPMDVDDDEDDVFQAEKSTSQSTDELIVDIDTSEETGQSDTVLSNGSPKAATCPEEINQTIRDNTFAMHGSFSQLNSSPDKDSPQLEKSKIVTPLKPSTFENVQFLSTPVSKVAEDNESESETSINLVDTDEEEEAKKKAALQKVKEEGNAAEIVAVSGLDSSILDKSFGSDKNRSSIEKDSEKNDSVDETNLLKSDSEDEIIEVMDSNDAKDMGEPKQSQVIISPKRRSLCLKNTSIEQNKVSDICQVSNNSFSLNKSINKDLNKTLGTTEKDEEVREFQVIKSPRKSVINSPNLRTTMEKSDNDQIDTHTETISLDNDDQDSEPDASSNNDSKVNILLGKTEKESYSLINEMQNITNIVDFAKSEDEIEMNSSLNSSTIESNNEAKYSDITLDSISTEEETISKNLSKSVLSPHRIILQSVEVIQKAEEIDQQIISSIQKSCTKQSRNSLTCGEIEEKTVEEQNTNKSRHSLPSKIRGEQNIAKINRRKSIAAAILNEKSSKQVEETFKNSDDNKKESIDTNKSFEDEINIISSEDEDNTSVRDDSSRKYSSIDSDEEEEKVEKKNESSIQKTPTRELSNTKRKSEGLKENKSTEEKTIGTKQDSEEKSPEKEESNSSSEYSDEEEKIEKNESNIRKTPVKELSNTKRRSEGLRENKSTEEKTVETKQDTTEKLTEKRRSNSSRKYSSIDSDEEEEKIEKENEPSIQNTPVKELSNTKRRSEGFRENKRTEEKTVETKQDKTEKRRSNSSRKCSSIDSDEEEEKVEKKNELSIRTTPVKELSNSKRRSEGFRESTEEKTIETKQHTKEKSPEKRRSKRDKKTIEILSRSGIDIEEEEEEEEDEAQLNEFIDDMAEEVEEPFGEEESDENEIKDEGESVLSSDGHEESSDDEYDSNDSFIDDEEQELLSGEEEFLEIPKKKKKYRRISGGRDSSSEDTLDKSKTNNQVEENVLEEPEQKLENEKSFEKLVDSILKPSPNDVDVPNETSTDDMNSSIVAESSVILQETCSIGAAKKKILQNKINGVVDVFCQNITESEGNISLNVSLNYKPPQNSLNVSMERSNSETNDDKMSQRSFNTSSRLSNENKKTYISPSKVNRVEETENELVTTPIKSSRLSNEKKRTSASPKKVRRVEDTEDELVDIETVETNYAESLRLSIEKINRISPSPKRSGEEKMLRGEKNITVLPEINDEESENIKTSKKSKKKSKEKEEKVTVSEKSNSSNKKHKKSKSSSKDRETTRKEDFKNELLEKKKSSSSSHKEESSKHSDHKSNSKKRRNENDDGDVREELKEKPEKKRIRFSENSEVISGEIKTSKQSEEKISKKEKREKRKNTESSDQEVPSKKRFIEPSDIAKKNLKEIKPTRSTHTKEFKKPKDKHQTVPKATASNKQNDWEEEAVEMQPSLANMSVSGFNLEKMVVRDFKNRMIYDTSRNKREPSVKSKKHHKK